MKYYRLTTRKENYDIAGAYHANTLLVWPNVGDKLEIGDKGIVVVCDKNLGDKYSSYMLGTFIVTRPCVIDDVAQLPDYIRFWDPSEAEKWVKTTHNFVVLELINEAHPIYKDSAEDTDSLYNQGRQQWTGITEISKADFEKYAEYASEWDDEQCDRCAEYIRDLLKATENKTRGA